MHGNVAEWTQTTLAPYPYRADDGRNDGDPATPKVVRGGSYCERPDMCRSGSRFRYPAWQRVYNVGFRVIVRDVPADATTHVARASASR